MTAGQHGPKKEKAYTAFRHRREFIWKKHMLVQHMILKRERGRTFKYVLNVKMKKIIVRLFSALLYSQVMQSLSKPQFTAKQPRTCKSIMQICSALRLLRRRAFPLIGGSETSSATLSRPKTQPSSSPPLLKARDCVSSRGCCRVGGGFRSSGSVWCVELQ